MACSSGLGCLGIIHEPFVELGAHGFVHLLDPRAVVIFRQAVPTTIALATAILAGHVDTAWEAMMTALCDADSLFIFCI